MKNKNELFKKFTRKMAKDASKVLEQAKKDCSRKFVSTAFGLRGSSGLVYR